MPPSAGAGTLGRVQPLSLLLLTTTLILVATMVSVVFGGVLAPSCDD